LNFNRLSPKAILPFKDETRQKNARSRRVHARHRRTRTLAWRPSADGRINTRTGAQPPPRCKVLSRTEPPPATSSLSPPLAIGASSLHPRQLLHCDRRPDQTRYIALTRPPPASEAAPTKPRRAGFFGQSEARSRSIRRIASDCLAPFGLRQNFPEHGNGELFVQYADPASDPIPTGSSSLWREWNFDPNLQSLLLGTTSRPPFRA
jgi:hypothetical protein